MDDDEVDLEKAKRPAIRAASWMAVIGAALGIAFGLIGATVFTATGITGADLPPLSASPTPSPTPSETEEPEAEEPDPEEPKPQLSAEHPQVAPGQRFRLNGVMPGVPEGTTLQVQVQEGDGPWEDFPVTTQVGADGGFETVVYTTRTGERKFRMVEAGTENTTPEVAVTIG